MKKLSLQEWRARPRGAIALYPGMYTMEYMVTEAGEKEYGAKLQSIITVFTEKEWETLLNSKEDYEKIGKLLVAKFKKDPDYLKNLITWSESQTNCLYDYVNKNLNAEIIGSLTNDQIAERYSEYVELYLAYHLKNTPSWWIAPPFVDKEIREYLSRTSVTDIDNVLSILTEPLEYQTENFREEISILDMAKELNERGIKHLQTVHDLPSEMRDIFNSHVREFSSISFGYNTGVVWDENHFIDSLNKALEEDPGSVKNAKFNLIGEKTKKRDELLTSQNFPTDIKNLIIALRQVAYLQELKKTTQTKSHPLLQLVVKKEIAKRLGISKECADYLTKDEVVDFLRKGDIPKEIRDELKERVRFCVHIIEEGKHTWLLGEEAKEFIRVNEIMGATENVKEIKGFVASRGKATGRVKVCESSTETGKVDDGDILVTAMTTPDFVPAMRKAAAIITNEGGVTCHAAIVSRELNKPCIIGTKFATKVLKDGDVVEVDANTGVVRIIT